MIVCICEGLNKDFEDILSRYIRNYILNSRKIILYRNRREPNGEILSGKATRIKDLPLLLRNR